MRSTGAIFQLNRCETRLGTSNHSRSYGWMCKQANSSHQKYLQLYRTLKTVTNSSQLSAVVSQPTWLHRTSSNFANGLISRKHFSSSSGPERELKPYVAKPYSYAFGKSEKELVYKTLGILLDERVASDSGQPILVSHHENIKKTFTEFNEDVNKLAKALHEDLGLKRGDVVGLWSSNNYRWVVIQYACAKIGIILCTINPFYRVRELDYALRKGEVKALLLPGKNSKQEGINNFAKIVTETVHLEDSSNNDSLLLKHIISIDGETYEQSELGNVKVHSYDKLVQKNSDLSSAITKLVTPDDTLMIMFTSGTTGKPKGAFLSHFTTVNNAILTTRSLGAFSDMKVCVPLPFFHSFAGVLGNIAMTAAPFQMIIPCLKYNVKQLVESMNDHKATHILATPTLAIDLLGYVKKSKLDIPSLKCLLAGGASVPVEIAHNFSEILPNMTDFRIGYGATELGPCTTACRPSDTFEKRTETVGTPLDFVELKLINPITKEVVKLGETGEIHSRGHNSMQGYWKDPVKTQESFDKSGWYNTGDLGVMDEQGFLKIIGRTKELIIVGGENVYPRELEELLHTHPEIVDVHVIGVPDSRKGEEVCAWVKLLGDNSKVTEDELREFCKKNISYFKVPKYFMFVDSFPITATGKAQKFIMRDISIEKLGLEKKQ